MHKKILTEIQGKEDIFLTSRLAFKTPNLFCGYSLLMSLHMTSVKYLIKTADLTILYTSPLYFNQSLNP